MLLALWCCAAWYSTRALFTRALASFMSRCCLWFSSAVGLVLLSSSFFASQSKKAFCTSCRACKCEAKAMSASHGGHTECLIPLDKNGKRSHLKLAVRVVLLSRICLPPILSVNLSAASSCHAALPPDPAHIIEHRNHEGMRQSRGGNKNR